MAPRDPASDRYSLGALAWFCVVGENPPHALEPQAVRRAADRAQEVARRAGVRDPAAFAGHLATMLAHDPSARPADARAWAGLLRGLGPGGRGSISPATPRKWRLRTAGVLLMAVVLLHVPLAVLLRHHATGGQTSGDTTRQARPASTVESTDATGLTEATGRETGGPPPGPPRSPPPNRDGQPGPPVPPAGGRAQPPPPGTWPEGAVTTDVAAFSRPRNGATIGRCPRLSGTSHLPPGRTLLFSVENLSVGDGIRHVTPIRGWQRPASLTRWQLQPPVGLPGDPVGEKYRLELIVVPLNELRTTGPRTVPPDSYVGASLLVSRGDRADPGC